MEYNIKLNKKQMQILVKSLDIYSRIEIGQFHTPIEESYLYYNKKVHHDELNMILNLLSQEFGFDGANHSYGIYNKEVDQSAREAYAMQQVIRHQLWKDNPNHCKHTVDSSVNIIDSKETKIKVDKI